MSDLNQVPSGDRIKIALFGKRNAGKSSLINALTGQDLAIVSEVLGTTTDPVLKNMELLPLGAVTIIDTPGLDDEGLLGHARVKKAHEWLQKADIAIVVVDIALGKTSVENAVIDTLQKQKVPYILVWNKADLVNASIPDEGVLVSALTGEGIEEVKLALGKLLKTGDEIGLLDDVVFEDDRVVLVVPIDKAAPKGRLILPQQQVIRACLDKNAIVSVLTPEKLGKYLENNETDIVICDSQVFKVVSEIVPKEIKLTSFSILMARYKGDLRALVLGVLALDELKDNDKILISEGCTHHRQCEDIGTVKLPKWISAYTNKNINFSFTSGGEFPEDLEDYQLIVHCGACMLHKKEVMRRLAFSEESKRAITNYGVIIAYMNGILKRTLSPFVEVKDLCERIEK